MERCGILSSRVSERTCDCLTSGSSPPPLRAKQLRFRCPVGVQGKLLSLQIGDHLFGSIKGDLIDYRRLYSAISLDSFIDLYALLAHGVPPHLRTHQQINRSKQKSSRWSHCERTPRSSLRFGGFQMNTKFAVGDLVDHSARNRLVGTVKAVYLTQEGEVLYAVDMEGHGTLRLCSEDTIVAHIH
jgi:hypothetical protein